MPTKKTTTKKGGRKPPTPRREPESAAIASVEKESSETEIEKVERDLAASQQKLLVLRAQAQIDKDIARLQAERSAVEEGSVSAAELLGRIDAGIRPPPLSSPEAKGDTKDKKDKKKRKKPDTSESDSSETDTEDSVSSSEDGFEDSDSDSESSVEGERATKKAKKDKASKKGKKGKVNIDKTIAHWRGCARSLPADSKREMKTLLAVMKRQHQKKQLTVDADKVYTMQLQLVMADCAAKGDKAAVNQYKALVLQKEGKSNVAGVFDHKLFSLACKQTGALQESPKNGSGAADGHRKRRTPPGQKPKRKPWNVIDNRDENAKKGGPKGGFCFRCDKPGHFARDCSKKPEGKEGEQG
jgi:hypothetical protein